MTGSGNVVIQVLGSENTISIAGAVALRLATYRQASFSEAPEDVGRRGEPGYTPTGRRETKVLSPFNRDTIPLVGRGQLLADLQTWLVGPGQVSVQVILGGGGRGKTRLATELVDSAEAEGWIAGFAERDKLEVFRAAGCDTQRDARCLFVVDYASAKLDALAAWFRALVGESGERPKLRILLLERVGGQRSAWWRRLFEQGGTDGEAVADLLAPGAPLTITALDTAQERHDVFAAAFEAATGQETPPASEHLDHTLSAVSLGGEPLFIAMFGLVAARQGLEVASALTADKIARRLAESELRRIGKVWSAHPDLPPGWESGADRPFDGHLAALATLSEGWSEAEAQDAIAREAAALHLALPGGSEPVRGALHGALPGAAGGIGVVLPDILGEALAMTALERLPDSGVAALRRAAEVKRAETTTAVIRACQDFIIRGERTPLVWLEALRADAVDLEALVALSNAMPEYTLELREIAVEITQAVLDLARALPAGDAQKSIVAASLNNHSIRLNALGRREAALSAIEEAAELYRSLAAARPDAFLLNLASSLNNLSNRLDALGRREEALAAVEEAVELYRRLAAARPDAFLLNLAGSLNNLSNRLDALGRQEEALAAIEEAVEIRRSLAAVRPDAFLPDLALSLNNLSISLDALGRREAALAAIEEAVELYRSLAATRPDAFLPNLATSLTNLSVRLDALGRREEALAAIQEAVELYRSLAAARPDAFLPDLALSLNNLSNCLDALGRWEAALAAIEEAVEIQRGLAATRPNAFLPDLAGSLNNLSNRLDALGRREEALAAIEEALEIRRSLAAARPDAFLPDLAASLNNLSGCLDALGRREAALAGIEEAVELHRSLAAARPNAFEDPLSTSLWVLADRLEANDRPEDAIASHADAIKTLTPIFQRFPAPLAGKMAAMAKEYFERCERLRSEPDPITLAPVIAVFKEMQGEESEEGEM